MTALLNTPLARLLLAAGLACALVSAPARAPGSSTQRADASSPATNQLSAAAPRPARMSAARRPMPESARKRWLSVNQITASVSGLLALPA